MRARTTSTRSSSGARRPASPPSAAEFRIARIGTDGDGVAAKGADRDARAFIPFTLPGERVLARERELVSLIEASPERCDPPCPHFGACGGCALQHWDDAAYAAWKSGLLRDALRRAGFPEAAPAPLARTAPASRRRIDLALRREGGRVLIGLHRRREHAVVDFATCTILHPALLALLPPLRTVLGGLRLFRRKGSAVLNLLDTGPDLLLRLDAAPDAADRSALAAFARGQRIPRIAVALGAGEPEIAVQLAPVSLALSGSLVAPPPGAFLQASAAGEHAIVGAVLAGLPERLRGQGKIIELFAGIGTLSFALAGRARVLAIEGDAAAHAALRRAATGTRIETQLRDLARQPLASGEIGGAGALVLDPPHAGAAAQMPGIAAAGVPVVYVSCNPAALTRDARMLHNAGYALLHATPIDQFLWSARLESVCVFAKPAQLTRQRRGRSE